MDQVESDKAVDTFYKQLIGELPSDLSPQEIAELAEEKRRLLGLEPSAEAEGAH